MAKAEYCIISKTKMKDTTSPTASHVSGDVGLLETMKISQIPGDPRGMDLSPRSPGTIITKLDMVKARGGIQKRPLYIHF